MRNHLRAVRTEQHVTQQELADRAGVTRQTISAIENCQYVPSTLLAFVLARCLGKTVTELFYLEEVSAGEKG
nr:helix-turn-helix transcriptional regulator [Symbiobacterium terraclitae]